jgi:hypothetical protein
MRAPLLFLHLFALAAPLRASPDRLPLDRWTFRQGDDPAWSAAGADPAGFREAVGVVGHWNRELSGADGVGWYRTAFELGSVPASAPVLYLGRIDDADLTFVNGERIGAGDGWTNERVYAVPARLVRAGRNVVAVRVSDAGGPGGFVGGRPQVLLGAAADLLRPLAERPRSGWAVANFAIAGEASPDGALLERLWLKGPEPGEWPDLLGSLAVSFESGGRRVRDRDTAQKTVTREWPFYRARFADPALPGVRIEVSACAPVPMSRFGTPAPPHVTADFEVVREDPSVPVTIEARFVPLQEGAWRAATAEEQGPLPAGGGFAISPRALLGWMGGEVQVGSDALVPAVRVTLPAGKSAKTRLVVGALKTEATHAASTPPDPSRALRQVALQASPQREDTDRFSEQLPRTGDADVDAALRWYVGSTVALTKVLDSGRVTLLCPSSTTLEETFWGGFPFVLYWGGLESRMLQQFSQDLQPDGRVRAGIFPTLDRPDDLSPNAFMVLRLIRSFAWVGQSQCCGREYLRKVLGWLLSRDRDGDGLPDPGGPGGDPATIGLRMDPRSAFLFLGALKHEIDWERASGGDPKDLEAALDKAAAAVHAPREKGGLWNGRHYVNVWLDGRADDRLMEDQVVGALLDVIPPERCASIFEALRAVETPLGVPAAGPGSEIRPGLNLIDAWARLHAGSAADGWRLLKKVARADLVAPGDFTPHATLAASPARALGPPRVENGVFHAAVVLGALGLETQTGGYRFLGRVPELQTRLSIYPFTVEWDGPKRTARVTGNQGGKGPAGKATVGFPAGEGPPPEGFEELTRGSLKLWAKTVEPDFGATVVVELPRR